MTTNTDARSNGRARARPRVVADKGLENVLAAISEPKDDKNGDPFKFTVSNGVVFRVKQVPPLLVMEAQARLPIPVPPKVFNPDKETEEENIHDPEYRRAVDDYRTQIGQTTNAILITRGTELLSVPDDGDIEHPDSESWADDLREFAGVDVPAAPSRRRYFLWVKYVALPTLDDWRGLVDKIQAAGGHTREEAVAKAAESFRDSEEGHLDPRLRIIPEDGRGDRDSEEPTRMRS